MTEELKAHHYWREDRITGRLVVITPDEYGQWGKDNQPSEAYRPAFTRAQLPSLGGEAVEVVACIDLDTDAGVVLYANREPHLDAELLMTVAQHQRIMAASVGSAEPVEWQHQAPDGSWWVIAKSRVDEARLAGRPIRPLYTHPADQVADDLTMVKVPRELLERLYRVHKPTMLDRDIYELRALLAKSEGAKG